MLVLGPNSLQAKVKDLKVLFFSVLNTKTCWNSSHDKYPSPSISNFLNANSTLSILSSSNSSTFLSVQKHASIAQLVSDSWCSPGLFLWDCWWGFCDFFGVVGCLEDFLGLRSKIASPMALHSKSSRCVSFANIMKSSLLIRPDLSCILLALESSNSTF